MYSIIIPIYNAEQYLHRCIDSILIQNYKDYELLLIDDGSTDNSGRICDDYASINNRIKVFHKPNGGVSSARNLGIKNAKGEWITFIDADDYIEQDYFVQECYNNADLLIQNWNYTGINKRLSIFTKGIYVKHELKKLLTEHLQSQIFLVPWAKFYKTNTIRTYDLKFNENFHIGEDTLFTIDYLYHTQSIKVINSSIYRYTPSDTSNKYRVNIDNALLYIKTFLKSYNKLGYKNLRLLSNVYNGYWSYLKDKDNPQIYFKWTNNKSVREISKHIYNKNKICFFIYYTKVRIYSIYKLFTN